MHVLAFTGLAQRITVKPDQTLLQAALDHGVAVPHLCGVGSCGSCKCRLVSGRVQSLVDLSYVLSADEIRCGVILPCQALARSDCVLSVPATAVDQEVPPKFKPPR